MILHDHDIADIAWPDAAVEARWVPQLERACRHLGDHRLTGVRAIILAEACEYGEAELRAVDACAQQLAGEHNLVVSVADHGARITVRLSRPEGAAGD